jgi:hypothetical protein
VAEVECDEVVRRLRRVIVDLAGLDRALGSLRDMEPYISLLREPRKAWESLRSTVVEQRDAIFKELEELLKKLPRVCR